MSKKKWRAEQPKFRGLRPIAETKKQMVEVCACDSNAKRRCICGANEPPILDRE